MIFNFGQFKPHYIAAAASALALNNVGPQSMAYKYKSNTEDKVFN